MKTKLFITGFLIAISFYASAQTIEVRPNETRVFNAKNPVGVNSFNWNISGAGYTVASLGSASATNPVTFGANVGDASTLTVTPVSTNGCLGATKSVTITITLPANLSYTAAITLPQPVCSGSAFSATITITGTTTGVGAGNPISVYYSLDGTPVATPVSMISASQSVSFPETLASGAHTYLITGVSFGTILSSNNVSQAVNVDAVPVVDGIF